jgi:SAM-dependent methyltransferase
MDASTATGAAAHWSAVADAWDESVEYVDGHSVEATDALVRGVAVRPGDRVLELAAGPGTLGPTWSELVGATGAVVVSDVAPGMAEVARRRNAGLANVEVAVLDLAAIDRPSASFDVVVSRMGLMFAPDPSVAMAEMHRVMGPGGRLGALTWGAIEHNPWMTCVGMAAMANGLVAGPPPVGPGGVFSLGDPAGLAQLATDAGFAEVVIETIETTFRADTIEAHVDRVSSLAGPLAAAFAAASAEQLEAVRRTAAQLAAPFVTDDGIALPGRAVLVTGRA